MTTEIITITIDELNAMNPWHNEKATAYTYWNVPGPGVEYQVQNVVGLYLTKTGKPERIYGWPTEYWCAYEDGRGGIWWIGCDWLGDIVTLNTR